MAGNNNQEVYSEKAFQTPVGRVSYPHLDKPDTKFDAEGKYRVTLLFPKNTDLTQLKEEMKKVIVAKWGAAKSIKDMKLPIKDGDKKYQEAVAAKNDKKAKNLETYQGHWAIELHSKNKPIIKGADGKKDITAAELYAGCWARALVKFASFSNNGEGLTTYVNALQFCRDDTRFGESYEFEAVEPPSDGSEEFDLENEGAGGAPAAAAAPMNFEF